MKRIATGIMTVALLAGLSVCSAEPGGARGDADVICRDGVCELAPAASAGREPEGLAATANPYQNAVPDVEGRWAGDVNLGPHDEFVAATSDPQAGVVFFAGNPIRNFKVLALEFKDMSPAGKPLFNVRELYTKDVLRPERPLLVKFSFFGSIPNNGFSYTDPMGKTRQYYISESGKDGSLLFGEL